MRRRKDSGFTLIELMIVIAVIGILAIVLVPRVGTVKAQAKEAGLDNNIRIVQGYVESKIDRWVNSRLSRAAIAADIERGFTFTDTTKQLANPISSQSGNAIDTALADIGAVDAPLIVLTDDDPTVPTTNTALAGSVVVALDNDATISEITIYAYGENGQLLTEKNVTIRP